VLAVNLLHRSSKKVFVTSDTFLPSEGPEGENLLALCVEPKKPSLLKRCGRKAMSLNKHKRNFMKHYKEEVFIPFQSVQVKSFTFPNNPKKAGGMNVSGKKGTLFVPFPSSSLSFHLRSLSSEEKKAFVTSREESDMLLLSLVSDKKEDLSFYSKALRTAMNTVQYGGFSEKLLFHGVGFRVELKNHDGTDFLSIHCGFSHPVVIPVPRNLAVAVPKQTTLLVSGLSTHSVQSFVSYVEKVSPRDPYKGKGIRKENTSIVLKEKKKK